MLIIGSVPWRKPGKILKNGFPFSASFKGIKNEAFPVKNLEFKIFNFHPLQNSPFFAKISKNHVLSFLLMSGHCVVNGR